MEKYDWTSMAGRTMLGVMVHFTLKPMFEMDVLSDQIDFRDEYGLLIIFSKDYSAPFPRLIMETTKFHESGKTEQISRDCFGMDCGLEVVKGAVTSMIFERCRRIMNKENDLKGG